MTQCQLVSYLSVIIVSASQLPKCDYRVKIQPCANSGSGFKSHLNISKFNFLKCQNNFQKLQNPCENFQ